MADWYVSSAAYAAITTYTISTAYTVGQIVKPVAPALKAQWAMRCTVAGTSAASEPSWPTTNNGTVVSGGATFANVTGQSAYGWGAAAGDLPTLLGAVGAVRVAGNDRVYLSSDHTETQAGTTHYGSGTAAAASYNLIQFLSVNRAGSVPPVAADLAAGAQLIGSGATSPDLAATCPCYHYGIIYSSTGASILLSISGQKSHYFDACQFYLNNAVAGSKIGLNSGTPVNVTLNNTTVRFGNAGQSISGGNADLQWVWLNTANPIAGATVPTVLFQPNGAFGTLLTCRGVDFSAVTGTLFANNATGDAGSKALFDSCRIAPGVVRAGAVADTRQLVEYVNCYDGTNVINEKYMPAGTVTTERVITLAGGATDDVGIFSHKLVSGTNIDKFVNTLDGFWMDVEYQTTGSSKTATVEIISSASLNNDEISLLLEYQGTPGSSVASFTNTLPATVLTAASAVATSTATWNSSPATPVKQRLSVTFVPQLAGRVRGQVRLGKPSTTCYVNPVITIS